MKWNVNNIRYYAAIWHSLQEKVCATSNYRERSMQLQKKQKNLITFQKLNLNTINTEGTHSKVSERKKISKRSVTLMFQGQWKNLGKIIHIILSLELVSCKDQQHMMGYILDREISMWRPLKDMFCFPIKATPSIKYHLP
jgi:hypothetical protein